MPQKPIFDELVNALTISEIVSGIMLNIGNTRFTEQALHVFFKAMDFNNRFEIKQGYSGLYSKPLRTTLTFMTMGHSLEDYTYYFKVRDSMRASIRQDLIERGVLPKYEEFFKNLANQFILSLQPTKTKVP